MKLFFSPSILTESLREMIRHAIITCILLSLVIINASPTLHDTQPMHIAAITTGLIALCKYSNDMTRFLKPKRAWSSFIAWFVDILLGFLLYVLRFDPNKTPRRRFLKKDAILRDAIILFYYSYLIRVNSP